jgi:hypothetical protein
MTDREVPKVLRFAELARNVQKKGKLYSFQVRVEMHTDNSWMDYTYYGDPRKFITFMKENYRNVRKIGYYYFSITGDKYRSFYYTGQKSTNDTYRYLTKALKIL